MATDLITEVEGYVKERFAVKETFYKGTGAAEFSLSPGESYKEKFEELARFLKPKGLVPIMRSQDGALVLYIETAHKSRRPPYIPLFLLAATVATVAADGYLRAAAIEGIISSSGVLTDTFLYTAFVMAALGAHELGHYVTGLRSGQAHPIPYFIPGIPSAIPTFGSVAIPVEAPVNRDAEFSLGTWASVVGMAVSALALFVGVLDTHIVSQQVALNIFGPNMTFSAGAPPAIDFLVGAVFHPSSQGVIILSPLVYAGWFGLLIGFVNIVPCGQLDGGHVVASFLQGWKAYLAVTLSIVVIAPVNFLMAVFVLFVSWGTRAVRPLEDISSLSRSKFYLYAGFLALAAIVYVLVLYPPIA
jgi:hypothetical protein